MAKVTDIQDKNSVSKEIQDKDLSRQTVATAIASTDYVMLQDTSGGYHKIAKASFTEAVRSALGSVINSTAKGTDIAKVPVLDSNNDLGMGTLANIASVLGANLVTYLTTGTTDLNLNSLCKRGIFASASLRSAKTYIELNYPIDATEVFVISVFRDVYVGFQIAHTQASNSLYYRIKWSTSDVWSAWKAI